MRGVVRCGSPRGFVRASPTTQTVLSQLSGLDTLMSANTTRTFNLGPYVHAPWTALAITVKEDLGDVLSWDAYPTSC